MLLGCSVGAIAEPLSGRRWEPGEAQWHIRARADAWRREGMCHGDRVLLGYSNRLEALADVVALWCLGVCVCPVSPHLTAFEVLKLAKAASPRFMLSFGGLDPSLHAGLAGSGVTVLDGSVVETKTDTRPMPALGLDDDALVLFTSGTTDSPKGVVLTHRALRARWLSLRQALGVTRFRRSLCFLPTYLVHGLVLNSLYPWLSGQSLFLVPPFQPEALLRLGPIIDEHEITYFSSVPAVWRLVLRAASPPIKRTTSTVFCTSAPLSLRLWCDIRRWTGSGDVFNTYGLTETSGSTVGTTFPGAEPEEGLVGVPWGAMVQVMPDVQPENAPGLAVPCRAGEVGHVWLSTPAMMRGYLGRDDLTARTASNGWLSTGDLGLLDDRGCLYLRGRVRDEINRGGLKIYPTDVDSVAERFPGVSEACCFACDDRAYGQSVAIAIVLSHPEPASLKELYGWLKLHLAEYQMPVRWHLLDAIPRTAQGKVSRVLVAEHCAAVPPVDLRAILARAL
jgi:acyl-CoA synthetase (AMP-forming)/AMP-acid ligase II